MLPVGKTNRDENILFPCEANRANQNAAHVVVFALLIPKLMHLWWQLLELSCLPSFYLLLVSVQTLKENLYGKRSYLCSKQHLKTWTRILCMCQFGCLILLVLLCQWWKIINTECLIYHGLQRVSALLAPKKREREKKSWKASVIGPLNGCYQLLSLPLILPVGKLFPQLQGAVGCCQFI